MKEIELPSYAEISDALGNTTLILNPSQAHGLICGIICGSAKKATAWEELITGGNENTNAHEVLQKLYDVSEKQLKEFLFEFQLILPDDEVELPLRAEALTLWSQGFLTGLKMTDIPIVGREPSELTEAIDDIIEVAKLNFEEVVASEEDEAAFVELVEYVRMAAILIYQDINAPHTPTVLNPSKQLH